MDLTEFITKHNLSISSVKVPQNPNMDRNDKWEAGHFLCTLQRNDSNSPHTITTYYSMGSGLAKPCAFNGDFVDKKGKHFKYPAPELSSVLDCLAHDASTIEYCRHFEDWCSELGYDPDSRKAESIYRVCCAASRDLERFLGRAAYLELLNDVERL